MNNAAIAPDTITEAAASLQIPAEEISGLVERYRIVVQYDPPPIPTWRKFAYCATALDLEISSEHGATPAEAIADLIERIGEPEGFAKCDHCSRSIECEEDAEPIKQHGRIAGYLCYVCVDLRDECRRDDAADRKREDW